MSPPLLPPLLPPLKGAVSSSKYTIVDDDDVDDEDVDDGDVDDDDDVDDVIDVVDGVVDNSDNFDKDDNAHVEGCGTVFLLPSNARMCVRSVAVSAHHTCKAIRWFCVSPNRIDVSEKSLRELADQAMYMVDAR